MGWFSSKIICDSQIRQTDVCVCVLVKSLSFAKRWRLQCGINPIPNLSFEECYYPFMAILGMAYDWLVGGFKHCLFSIIYGIILPIDFHIFQDGYIMLYHHQPDKLITINHH